MIFRIQNFSINSTTARERADNIIEVEVSERGDIRTDEEVASRAPIVANIHMREIFP